MKFNIANSDYTGFTTADMWRRLTLSSVLLTALVGCASQPQEGRNNTAVGAVVGAVTGAVIGGQLDDDGNRDRGILVGAAAGAAVGAGIGAIMDRQEQEFRAALEEEQRRSQIEIERVREDLLKLTFDSNVTFDFDSALVKTGFQPSLDKVASVLWKYQSQAEIVGHTDSIGSQAYNRQLSEDRAIAVKVYLMERGIPVDQLSSYGRGEREPREDNRSEAGRQLNRRVEILVHPATT